MGILVPQAMGILVAILGLGLIGAPVLATPDDEGPLTTIDLLPTSTLLPCETTSIDVGEKIWRRAHLIEGFHNDERSDRSFAWTRRKSAIRIVLSSKGPRTLELKVRSAVEDQQVNAFWNGHDLGTRPVPRRWSSVHWDVPQDLGRVGSHRLELQASSDRLSQDGLRPLALAIDAIQVGSAADCGSEEAPVRVQGAVELPPGSMLLAPHRRPPEPRLKVVASGNPGAALEVFSFVSEEQDHLGTLHFGPTGHVDTDLDLGSCCQVDMGLLLLAQGPEAIRLESLALSSDDRPQAWRQAYGLVTRELLLLALLLGVTVLLARSGQPLPLAHYAPWLDVALVFALALVLRLIFLQEYPEPGRSADAFEYLMRSKRLAEGRVSFFHDTAWHGWQTWTRPPGYYLFLATLQSSLDRGVPAALYFQAFFSAIAAGATYLMAYPLFGRGAALLSGLLFAVFVESIVTFSRILTEPLYMLFLVPALAALAHTSARPSVRSAALAGALFGCAALVRSAPFFYVPVTAVLLLFIQGFRTAWRSSAALVGAMFLVILPWCVRNSMIEGRVTGIDNLAVTNLLQVSPDDRFVKIRDLDLDTVRGARTYYTRLQGANEDGQLAGQAGAILRATLEKKWDDPVGALRTFGTNLWAFFAFDDFSFQHTHNEARMERVLWIGDASNLQYLLLLVLGSVGFLATIRDPRTWPIALWFVFNTVIINLMFHPETKYRFPLLPVLMVFTGCSLARGLAALGRKRKPESEPAARTPSPTPE